MVEVQFDQHFLKNEEVLDSIIESSELTKDDVVFEIGPGEGVLSKKLLSKNIDKLISVELDESLKDELSNISDERFELVFGNGLELLSDFKFDKLIANIPYSITEPLYKRILDLKLPFVVMLHGLDFYRNIVDRDTRWKFFVPAFYDVELIRQVSGDDFEPRTKVKSAVVCLKLKSELSDIDKLIQSIWSKRERAVLNCLVFSLVDVYGISKKEAKEKVIGFGIESSLLSERFDKLSNTDLCRILDKFQN